MYRPLKIDFEIPNIIEDDINELLTALNNGAVLVDCYEQNLRADLNGCDLILIPEQDKILRDYYVKGGIYANTD